MRAVTSLLRAASKLPAGLSTAHKQCSFEKVASTELLRHAQLSSVTATRSHACAWGCMHTVASAPTGLQTGSSSGIACKNTVMKRRKTPLDRLNNIMQVMNMEHMADAKLLSTWLHFKSSKLASGPTAKVKPSSYSFLPSHVAPSPSQQCPNSC